MTKFKVGDKAKVISLDAELATACGAVIGEIVEVVSVSDFGGRDIRCKYSRSSAYGHGIFSPDALEKLPQTPTKNQRLTDAEHAITTLESEVADLKAKVEALETAQKRDTALKSTVEKYSDALRKIAEYETDKRRKKMSLTPNEQRKAIIAEAKAFIEDAKNFTGNCSGRKGYKYASTRGIVCDVEFNVNAKKRTVVALLKYQYGGYVAAKAIAKCAPDDVFNADIGKAIALGRALGLDVSRFEQAVKPTEVVVGQVVKGGSDGAIYKVVPEFSKVADVLSVKFCRKVSHRLAIIDDTEAVY